MPIVERASIENNLLETIEVIKTKRKVVNDLKKSFVEHGVLAADIQDIISGKKPLSELSMSLLCLLCIKLFEETDRNSIDPKQFFTPQEIKQSQTFEVVHEKTILPYSFSNVTFVRDGNYSTVITAQEIKNLMDANLLTYNFETQREAKVEKDKDDQIVLKPKTNPKSVSEIAELLKTGDLETTTITFNALVNTSDSGEELVYDHKNKTLTITKGTQINILDGYHRISGVVKALDEDESLDTVFDLKILNYPVKRAVRYFNQINKVNPISESRLKETNLSNLSTTTLEELKNNCDYLIGKISSGDKLFTSVEQLVSSKVLIDAIDDHFNPTDRLSARETGMYLAEFFTELFETYPDAFIRNINEVRKMSLINANYMFDGYVLLAKKLKEQGIPLKNLKSILDKIDFSRTNQLWKEIGFVDEDRNITANPKRKIRQFIGSLFNEVTADA